MSTLRSAIRTRGNSKVWSAAQTFFKSSEQLQKDVTIREVVDFFRKQEGFDSNAMAKWPSTWAPAAVVSPDPITMGMTYGLVVEWDEPVDGIRCDWYNLDHLPSTEFVWRVTEPGQLVLFRRGNNKWTRIEYDVAPEWAYIQPGVQS